MRNIILRDLWNGQKVVKAPVADGDFSGSPLFNFNDDKLKFNTNNVSNANDNYGSVSAFVPKYQLSAKGIRSGYLLLLLTRLYPATKHTTNLINDSLQECIFLQIKTFTFFHKTNKKSHDIEFYARLF